MPTSLDIINPRQFHAGREVAKELADKRAAEEELRQQRKAIADRAAAIAPHQLAQEQEAARKAQEAALQRTMESDLATSAQDPDLVGKQFQDLDIDYRKHLGNAYGPVAGNLARTWNSQQAQTTGVIPGLEPHSATVGPEGMTQHFAQPAGTTTTGQVTERDLAEAGLDPASIPRDQWATALSAKREPTKAKLDVTQKAALGSAAQAVPVMMSAMQDYDAISSQAGPIMGRVSGLREKMGMGGKNFAEANSKLQGNLFNVARALQGAGVLTEKDMTRMEQIAPALTMSREQFEGKVNAVKELMRERLTAWRDLNMNALDESQRALVDRLIEQTNPQAAKPAATGNPATPKPASEPTATNPATGQKVVFRNGSWQPM